VRAGGAARAIHDRDISLIPERKFHLVAVIEGIRRREDRVKRADGMFRQTGADGPFFIGELPLVRNILTGTAPAGAKVRANRHGYSTIRLR
jgi:hypothetical protein